MKNTGTPEFQDRVARFVAEHDLEAGVEIRLLDLLSELGEVAGLPLGDLRLCLGEEAGGGKPGGGAGAASGTVPGTETTARRGTT